MASYPSLRRGAYYHIYNRGNNRENVFREPRNYAYFLKLYAHYVEPVAETYAYCLLVNHFHFLVRIKDAAPAASAVSDRPRRDLSPSQAFSNLFNAYAKAVNRAWGRTGSLFEHPFGRVAVTSQAYLCHLVTYIHRNPQRHGLVDDFRNWPHSSYHALLGRGATRLQRDALVSWFGRPETMLHAHRHDAPEPLLAMLSPNDFD
jgi:REP element-mobilizing transposase RayT